MADKETKKDALVRERKERTPVGGARDVLTVNGKDPNYVYRWVLDAPGRVTRFEQGGYEVVTDALEIGQRTVDRESKVGSAVTKASGSGGTLVLMRILKEWYDEDQQAKQDRIDDLEATMRQEATQRDSDYGKFDIGRKR